MLMLFRKVGRRWGAVGPQPGADGTTPPTGRQSKTGEAAIAQTHGKYYEAASRGVLFAACDQGAGITVQVTITTTATLALSNPPASQKRVAIKKVSLSYFSGTLGAGSWYHGFNAIGIVQPASGTLLTSFCTNIGNEGAAAAVATARTGATVVAGKVLYPLGSSLPILASTAGDPFQIVEDVDGIIVLEPGTSWQLLGVFGGAGSSPVISAGIVWEEIPYVSSQG
jgi:hypothetical protein